MMLAYDDQGSGPPVVFLHGFPFNRSTWRVQVEGLRDSYRVIVPDLRGHGASKAPEGVYTIDEQAGDVVELLDALKITEPVVVAGLSMGGYVALALTLQHHERVRGLILIDTRAGADTPEAAKNRETSARTVEVNGTTSHVIEGMLPRLFAESTRSRRPDLITQIRQVMESTAPRAVIGALRGMAIRPDRTADLARIHVPTLIIVGADDAITPPDESRKMAEKLSNAELVIVPEAGHLAPLENPRVCNEAILGFLGRLG
jgi:pimeloyl-ACP methyl ester carboxylesterase